MRRWAPPETLQIQLREMVPEDLPNVLALQRASFSHPWSSELLSKELTHEWSTILVAEDVSQGAPRLVGCSIFWIVHDELHLLNIATHAGHRRQGIGRLLLQIVLERARQRGCALATLEVRRNNDAALQLYKSAGFRAVGIRPNYYVEEQEDAVVMVLDLV